MGRRLLIVLVLVAVFVAGGVAYALLSGDDDGSDTATGTTTTTTATTVTPSAASTSSTTAPTTTTLAPVVPPDSCGAEGAAIRASVNNGVSGASERAQIEQCRVAAVDPSWAAVRLVAKPGAVFPATTVVLQGGGGAWAIVETGGPNAACNRVPQQVLVDLGIVCSSSGGGGI